MQDRARAHPKVTVHLNTGVQDAYADAKGNMGGLMLTDSTTGEHQPAAAPNVPSSNATEFNFVTLCR